MTRLAPRSSTRVRALRDEVAAVVETVEAESATYNQVTPTAIAIRKVAIILVTAALAMTFVWYFRSGSNPAWLLTTLDAAGLDGLASFVSNALLGEGNTEFNRLVMFVFITGLGFIVVPLLTITLVLREPVRDYGLRFSGMFGSWRPYAMLFAVAVPFLVLASFNSEFQSFYPLYDLMPAERWWPYLWLWWLLYAVQFVGVEFFFRGFMVHGLKLRLGFSAVFVAVVPYTMLHFHKPLPETLAAIIGGTVLGFLSLKTRSIWWGVVLHIAIAGSIDVLALSQVGSL